MNFPRHLPKFGRIAVLCLVTVVPAFAQMVLISEARSVTASYFGGGVETHASDGTFGVFAASAVGTPFGGGSVFVSQTSNITPSEITIEHHAIDMYGPGGWAESDFEVKFSLPQDTRIVMTGSCNFFSGFVSLVSESRGPIPTPWGPDSYYRNYLDFDEVLGPGVYTLSSFEVARENVVTRIAVHASTVPDDGASGLLLAVGLFLIVVIRARLLPPPALIRTRA